MKLTFRHLEILREVARTENFTKAAERLYITQSAVSHAVRELEEQTGALLFDRLSKKVRLTRAGHLLLEESLPILSACESLEAHMPSLEARAPVSIVSSITIATLFLPGVLKQFHTIWPDTPVHVHVVSAASALETLKMGQADLALTEGTKPPEPYLASRFACCRLCAAASPGYRSSHHPMTIEEFCREKLLLREKGSSVRDILDSELYLTGRSVSPTWTSVDSQALAEAAASGLGIAVLPQVLIHRQIREGRLTVIDVEGLKLENDMYAVRHKDKYLTPALREILSLLEQLS